MRMRSMIVSSIESRRSRARCRERIITVYKRILSHPKTKLKYMHTKAYLRLCRQFFTPTVCLRR